MLPDDRRRVTVVDTHYGGDVSRVVLRGVGQVPGDTVLAKRNWLEASGDGLRRLMLYPPYGNPSMCVNLIVDPDLDEAEAGYVIMEAMGYPHFSGSNSICVVTALLESGAIPLGEPGIREVYLEAPAGLIRAQAEHDGRHVGVVTLEVDPAWVAQRGLHVDLPGHGTVAFDLVWSGCYYAVVDAAAHGFALTPAEVPALTALAHELCLVATPQVDLEHPEFGDTGELSFVCFAGPIEPGPAGALRSRSATYVHPDVLCACPTGTGTAARLALLNEDGRVHPGSDLVTISPTGSTMTGRVIGERETAGHTATRATVSGRAFTLGRLDLVVNHADVLVDAESVWSLLDTSDADWGA